MRRVELPPLSDLRSVQRDRGWLRDTVVIDGVEHYLDLVRVHQDQHGIQRAATKDLDAMLQFHHLACGADGPFATVSIEGHSYVVFLTPSCT